MGNSNAQRVVTHNLPVIAGHEITMDEHGRFNLNAIHKASAAGQTKRPSVWRATKQAQELVSELEDQSQNSGFAHLNAKHGGKAPGTFAHELLAVSYAGWISPKFQLQVNQVFLDYRMGRLQQAANDQPALPHPLTPAHQRSLQKAISRRAQAMPESVRRTAYSRMHRHLKDRFEVASYRDIDESRFTEALGAVESISLEGEFMPKSEALAVPEDGALTLSPEQVASLLTMCQHTKWMANRWQRELGPALQTLGSHHANDCHEHIVVAARMAHAMQRAAGVLPEGT